MPYFGQRTTGLYSPQDTKNIQWQGGTTARTLGVEMDKDHAALNAQDQEGQNEYAQNRAMAMGQAQHEAALQSTEQQRRMYDSETQRLGQSQKYGVLSGLLRG